MSNTSSHAALASFLVQGLVDDRDAVQTAEKERRGRPHIEVKVGDGDMGRVVGKQGRTIKALRAVFALTRIKQGGATVDVVDD
jgi:predicted RNA-binding protein YlqC (UPF0109 family)